MIDKTQQPVCDVVVVSYNSGAYLKRCLLSLYRSDVPISITLVDNASSDDSLAQIKTLDTKGHRLKIIENTDNRGFAQGVNQGANVGKNVGEASRTSNKAPYVFLLNPDCEIHPHTIKSLLKEARIHDDCGIMGALVFNEDGSEQRGCRRLEPTFSRSVVTALQLDRYFGQRFQSVNLVHHVLPEAAISIDAVSGCAMLIERATFERLNGMDEAYFLHVEDLDICRRVRELGKKVYFTPKVSLFHHHGASGNKVPVSTEWFKHQGMLRYQEKFQKPNQSVLRSKLTRMMIYVNFALSIVRKRLSTFGQQEHKVQSLVLDAPCTLITGASSDLGASMLKVLNQDERVKSTLLAVSRRKRKDASIGNEIWLQSSFFEKVPLADFKGVETLIAFSPVWAATALAERYSQYGKIARVIALSSTSIEGKAETQNHKEQKVIAALIRGEQDLSAWAKEQGAKLTLCRASMIYGGANNKNIALIKRLIKWFRFFPMASNGKGLRQPVHIDDLSKAVHQILAHKNQLKACYVLAGGERLPYREMISRLFLSLGRTPAFVDVPETVLRFIVSIISKIPGQNWLNLAMLDRVEKDLIYDISPAKEDFNYKPRDFQP